MVSEKQVSMATRTPLDELPPTRAAIFRLMKSEGFVSIPRVAEVLGISHEAARKQIGDMLRNGWVGSDCETDELDRGQALPGRPSVRYCLTPAGDHFFVKQYPEMTVRLLDAIVTAGGAAALSAVLTQITDERVERLEPQVGDLPLKRKMSALRSIYRDGDPFTDVQRRGDDYVLVERNCPYLNVALERPDICSTTVSALRRLTGCEVVRERRFQDGDRRCEFHVRASEMSPDRQQARFEKEPPRQA
jgi:predicted ArsR family transcriptional regulator